MNIDYAESFNFKPKASITPYSGYWQNGTWKFNMPEITAGTAYQPSYMDVILHGNTALTLVNAKANSLNYLKLFGGTELLPETYIDSVTAEGKCYQGNVPEGYTEYDGLIGDGNAYIDLNCLMTQNDELEIEFTKTSEITSRDIGGYRISATSNNISSLISSTGNVVADFNNSNYTPYRLNEAISLNTKYKVVINKTGRYLYQGSTLVASNTTACNDTFNCATCCLFKIGGFGIGNKFIGIIHRASIKGKRDVVPASNGTTYGMYDKLNGVFYPNANDSGSFTVGNAVTPSPSTPMQILCNNGVIKVSPNLYNPATRTTGYYISTTGVMTTESNSYYSALIPVQPNTAYVYSGISKVGNKRLHAYDSNGDWIEQINYTNVAAGLPFSTTGTTPNNCKYVRISGNQSDTEVQLEQGSTATTYMPYGQIYTDGTTETVTDNASNVATCQRLLSVGNYKDTQEILSGVVSRNVGIKVLDGTEDWVLSSAVGTSSLFHCTQTNMDYTSTSAAICTHYIGVLPSVAGNIQANQSVKAGYSGSATAYTRLYLRDTSFATTSDLTTFLATQYANGTPVIVVYPLATPTTESVAGQTLNKAPVTYSGSISGLTGTTVTSSHTVPTPTQPLQINCNNGVVGIDGQGNIIVTGTTETVEIKDENDTVLGTATAQDLYAVGTYEDVQEVLEGDVTRKVRIKVLDGTETWNTSITQTTLRYTTTLSGVYVGSGRSPVISTHFKDISNVSTQNIGGTFTSSTKLFIIPEQSIDTVDKLKAWLADQYNAGTPVIVIYPLATATTESVTPQSLTIQEGTNIVEITEASMSNLPLEVSYKAGVTVTVTEVENAQLDNSVEVTING